MFREGKCHRFDVEPPCLSSPSAPLHLSDIAHEALEACIADKARNLAAIAHQYKSRGVGDGPDFVPVFSHGAATGGVDKVQGQAFSESGMAIIASHLVAKFDAGRAGGGGKHKQPVLGIGKGRKDRKHSDKGDEDGRFFVHTKYSFARGDLVFEEPLLSSNT